MSFIENEFEKLNGEQLAALKVGLTLCNCYKVLIISYIDNSSTYKL